MTDRRRGLPSVDRLLRLPAVAHLAAAYPRALLVRAAREAVGDARAKPASAPEGDTAWEREVVQRVERAAAPTLRRCINATGIVVHTNLGRAPLAVAATQAIIDAARAYSSLEYDVERGARGDRHVHCASLLAELTGGQDALVVNNAASALMLALAAAAEKGAVVVSRGELIEIGGGFRIPEVMERSGASLIEVGTTNRTRTSDYEKAIKSRKDVRALLKVHRSNFRMEGFVEDVSLAELVRLGRAKKLPVIHDLGGGLMTDLSDDGLSGEPTLPESVRQGGAAVIASGDKLLGGPQAGILVGKAKFVAACRRHPLARAVRADKLTLAGLAATLSLYRDTEVARREVPVLRMLTVRQEVLRERATRLVARLPLPARATVVDTRSAVGGGSFPGVTLGSAGVALESPNASALAARLRGRKVPVIGTVSAGRLVLDLRTVLPGDEDEIARAVSEALAS